MALGIFSMMLAFCIPAYRSYLNTQRLRGSTENLAAQMRVARERALSTGIDLPLHFYENTYESDYHIHRGFVVSNQWNFPPGVHYAAGTTNEITMAKDGSASPTGLVILRDDKGRVDTLSVLASGIVLIR